jgi:hypothetical protein
MLSANSRVMTPVVAATAMLLAGVATSVLAQTSPPKTDTTRGLSIQYSDGRVSTGPVRRTGGMWTDTVPTVAGADTSRNGVRLTTLDIKHVADGSNVDVTVTLYYGGPGQNGVTVAKVRLSGDEPVRVDELRSYGVEPITLSLVALEPSTAYAPDVVSVSGQLTARAQALGANVSAYRVVITNRSSQALMWLQFKAYRGNRVAILGRPKGKRNQPLILPNAEYSFDVTNNTAGLEAADGSEMWQPLDRIELTSMMWQDGMVEGDAATAADQRRIDLQVATQLESLLAILRAAPERPLASVRAALTQAMGANLETRRARDSILQELDRVLQSQATSAAPEFRAWLSRTIPEYEQWLARIVRPAL